MKLLPGASDMEMQNKLDSFIDTFAPSQYHGQLRLRLEPLTQIYLDGNNGNARRVCAILAMIAALILAIACANFMNLTIARSLPRAKEIAVKTILGASRGHAIFQLLVESFIVSFVAAVLAILMTEVGLQHFLQLFGRSLVLKQYWDVQTISFVGMLIVLITVIAGGYNAIQLTLPNPVNALKGSFFKKNQVLISDQFS